MARSKRQMAMAAGMGLIFLLNTAQSQTLSRGQQWVRSHPFTINAMNEGGFDVPQYREVGFGSVLELINQTNYGYAIGSLDASTHAGEGWHWMTSDSDYTWIRTTAQDFLNRFPHNLGFCIGDESSPSLFPQMAVLLNDIRTLAPNAVVYHAVRPMDDFTTADYNAYLDSVVNTLRPDVLMYDQYPFCNGGTLSTFYTNLAIVREKALAAKLPYWYWLQSHGRTGGPQQEPSESEMRLQAFTALAYGYTGLSYWTYASNYYPYSHAMVTGGGLPTDMYNTALKLVPEIKKIGDITKSLTSTGVYFQPGSGYSNPEGTTLWSSSADSRLIGVTVGSGSGFLIGFFKDDSGEDYFMIVNTNHAAGQNAAATASQVSLQFAGSVTSLARLNRSTGRFEIVTPGQLSNYEVPGGTGELFKYNTAGLATYEFPASFGANPTGQWSLASGAAGWSTANDLASMVPNPSAPNWTRSGNATPRLDGDLWVLCGNAGLGNGAGVLVYQVPKTGRYSINTLWYAYGAGGDPASEYLSVRIAPDAATPAVTLWSSSYSWPAGSGMVTAWDLGAVPQLQSIDLKAGSYIFFSMNVTQAGYPTAYNRFFHADGSLGGAISLEEAPLAAIYRAPVTFSTNPQNQWSLQYGVNTWSLASDLAVMAPNSTAPNWNRPEYGAPRVDSDLWVLSGNAGWPGNDAGVLVFQAPITGRYSINTNWYAYGAGGDPTTEYLSVRVAPNASSAAATLWSTSYSWPLGSGMVTGWDLGAVSELQSIDLTAGSYVFFSMNVQTQSYYPTAYNRFLYPVTLTLLSSSVTPLLSVTPAGQSVGSSAGSTTFAVANTGTGDMSWSAQVTAGGDWLQITGGSGTNAGTITANYQANTGAQRTGTIHVDAGSAGTADVTVIQAAGQVQQPTVHGTVTYTDVAGYPLNTVTIEIRNGATAVETHSALALTGSTGSKTYTFTTSLTGPYTLAIVKNAQTGWKESVQSGLTIAGDTTVNFTVTHALAGDASMDNKVDVSDLGILAANYGQTGKTWSLGDFNGDGKVDVSDLGILAAHYGTGTGFVLEFKKDAIALGLMVGDPEVQKDQTPEVSASGCGTVGLPLVAGLLLMGVLLVKLDE